MGVEIKSKAGAAAWAVLATSAALLAAAGTAAAGPAYTMAEEAPLGGADNWDYLSFDAARGRVAVAHKDAASFYDAKTGRLLGEIRGLAGSAHGVAVSADGRRGWATHGHEVAVFDAETYALTSNFDMGSGAMADFVIFDAASDRAFAVDHVKGRLHAFGSDLSKDGDVQLGGTVEALAVDGKGSLFANIMDKREIVRVDTRTLAETGRWPVPTCEAPHGLAVDPLSGLAFATCVNSLMVSLDTKTGKVLQEIPIGRRTDAAAFDPKRRVLFSSNGDGTLTSAKIAPDGTIGEPVSNPTALGAKTMALDPESGRVFLVAGDAVETPVPAPPASSVSPGPGAPPPAAAASERPKTRIAPLPGTAKLKFYDPAP